MTIATCTHPVADLEILGFLPDGFVTANCRKCGEKGVKAKLSDSFEDRLDIPVSDLNMLPDDHEIFGI